MDDNDEPHYFSEHNYAYTRRFIRACVVAGGIAQLYNLPPKSECTLSLTTCLFDTTGF